MKQQLDTSKFHFVGNNLSVDFINTQIRANGALKELLESFEDLIAWALRAELLDLPQAKTLLRDWRDKPKAAQVFKHASLNRTIQRLIGFSCVFLG